MHAEPTRPLSIAAAVLMPSTLASVYLSPSFHRRGWQILDRWAFESPALRSAAALEQRRRGLAEQEILALHEIRTTLA
ncbi:hypothetical protein [Burkholderia cenocepacia]|uniref:hypothetical protein n=1 Tax=Burkholderia cenocepacia TaxID=95486 RepID=UPI001CF28D63|nr:hypothetical protein [Burkholderia cenocepacia]MCA8005166.1 hypothetical protein [Burkholderia cenocepacia]